MNYDQQYRPIPAIPLAPTEEEIRTLEAENAALRGQTVEHGFHLVYEDAAFVRALEIHPDTSRWLIEEFEEIARWHSFRNRPDLSARYSRCAEVVRAVEAENISMLN